MAKSNETLEQEMTNLSDNFKEFKKEVTDNHTETMAELKSVRTDMVTRHDGYMATFATKSEVADALKAVNDSVENGLKDQKDDMKESLAPFRRAAIIIGTAFVGILFTGGVYVVSNVVNNTQKLQGKPTQVVDVNQNGVDDRLETAK